MLGSAVLRRRRVVAAAVAFGGAACAATVAKPASAAWGAAPKPPAPLPGSAPDARSAPSDAYMKQALSGVLKHGMPSKENVKYRDGHCLAYDRATRNPRWVGEHLTRGQLSAGSQSGVKRRDEFHEEPSEPPIFRARLSDYRGSGYDRGHMAAAADMKHSQHAMDSTFFLSNMCPQVGDGFNRDYWARFEQFARDLTKSYADVYVFSGPLYMPARASNGKWIVQYEMLGDDKGGHVAVPTHFFKVIMAEERGRIAIGAFIMPNKPIAPNIPLEKFTVELATVESASGLHFFERLRAAGSVGGVLQKGLCSDTTCVLPPGYHEAKARAKL